MNHTYLNAFKVFTLIFLTGLFLLTGCSTVSAKPNPTEDKSSPTIKIGITQIVEHSSLDEIRSGIIDGLKDSGYSEPNLVINYENAQGAMENAQMIADRFNQADLDLVIAITTPSAQAAMTTLTNVPVIYSAVTDPQGAGLVGQNITGVSDLTPVNKQLTLLKALLPHAKHVGMVYNTAEQNSVVQIELAKKEASALGLSIKAIGISSTSDLSSAIDESLTGVDAFYAHVDNNLASAFDLLKEKADKAHVPIIGAVKAYVDQGALATDGIDNYKIGYQTGLMAAKYLSGTKLSDIPAETTKETVLLIRADIAKQFQVNIPDPYQDFVK